MKTDRELRLEAALKPLADLSKVREPAFYDCPADLILYDDHMGGLISVGDVRRAREALKG